jgi:hypothetical protein
MARRVLLTVGLGLLGVLAAASIGYASYLVSRDEVGLPVTKLEQAPQDVVPVQAQTQPQRTTSTRTGTSEDRTTSTGDDSGGDSSGKGSGGDSSGKGSGGGDDFDDD